MSKSLILLSLWLGLAASILAAETWTLTDGTSVSGDIVMGKVDDHGMMIHTTADAYTTFEWARFSQDALKQLAANPKIKPFVDPFINPTESERPPKPATIVNEVTRLKSPAELNPSVFGGLLHSSVGLFILFVIYLANLYAAFEVAVVRGKPVGLVIGLSALLPIAGPIIFLLQPMKPTATEEEPSGEAAPNGPTPAAPTPGSPADEIQIVAASWQPSQEEKKPQPQTFSRGKFTLNKRFIETKFAGFMGEPKGDALKFSMEIKTLKDTLAVEGIKQLSASEAILETPNGQVTVPLGDIQEIRLIPKTA